LEIKSEDGQFVAMPLSDYLAWHQLGFQRTGRFADVKYEPNEDMNPAVQRVLHDVARNHREAIPLLQNLAGNSILRDVLRAQLLSGQSFDERDVGVAYLRAWMEREHRADARPAQSAPRHLDLYVRLLSKVAETYLDSGLVDDEGYFEIHPDHTVSVDHMGKRYSFPVERTIAHSGLKQVDPRRRGIPKYRFNPIWVHRALVEQTYVRLAVIAE
jgi:hypothetical protein